MQPAALIKQELVAAEAAWNEGNEGKARVCARRAVGLSTKDWLEHHPVRRWRGDAMEHLRQIQQDASFPLSIRQAAQRLSTTVNRQQTAPFTTDPIGDAKLIIAHLAPTLQSEC
jgi:hypothetical protein